MLFSEIYSSYFNVVAKVLEEAVNGSLTEKRINDIIMEKAFSESILSIPNALKNGDWKLLDDKLETPIKHTPEMPLTLLQKQWLKAIMNDKRIKLFSPSIKGLEDIESLYEQDTIVYFDRYTDGDDFENPEYIKIFQTILEALHKNRKIKIRYTGKQWKEKEFFCSPVKLEYSSKNDKFRLKAIAFGKLFILNLSKISSCELLNFEIDKDVNKYTEERQTLILYLYDKRNALERVMLSFSNLEKEAERIDDYTYKITMKYDKDDETEILIRVLSFGPMIRVISPESFISQLKNRIEKQKGCEL
ncbi:MAG: WYL domain-containing protein [Eubacterium sp.]|nr:WYL domain-containing protein [Eubacterium sp.]